MAQCRKCGKQNVDARHTFRCGAPKPWEGALIEDTTTRVTVSVLRARMRVIDLVRSLRGRYTRVKAVIRETSDGISISITAGGMSV
jgi:hypothetical protein